MSDKKIKEWEKWFKQFDPALKDVSPLKERGFRDFVAGRPAPPPPAPQPAEKEQNSKEDEKV